MHLLSCPNCQAELLVTPAQAGDSIQCSKCQQLVAIPKLGELRKLPQTAPQTANDAAAASDGTRSVAGTIAFVALSLVAAAALLGAGYNGIRWAMIETKNTNETHLRDIEASYMKVEPAALVLEFEDMEKFSLDMVTPYKYQVIADEKSKWGWNTVVASGLAAACGVGAFIAASQSRNG